MKEVSIMKFTSSVSMKALMGHTPPPPRSCKISLVCWRYPTDLIFVGPPLSKFPDSLLVMTKAQCFKVLNGHSSSSLVNSFNNFYSWLKLLTNTVWQRNAWVHLSTCKEQWMEPQNHVSTFINSPVGNGSEITSYPLHRVHGTEITNLLKRSSKKCEPW